MHLHANSMNILSARLQAETLATEHAAARQERDARRKLLRSPLPLYTVEEDGAVPARWDGDARRQPDRRAAPQAMRATPVTPAEQSAAPKESISIYV